MRLEDRIYAQTDLPKLIEYASYPEWHLDKAHAMYELAFRALKDSSLLELVWRCIGTDIVYVARQGPPLGQPAASLLLKAHQSVVEKALVNTMRDWSKEQQADFFLGLIEKADRRAFLERLVSHFGFEPKITIDATGALQFD